MLLTEKLRAATWLDVVPTHNDGVRRCIERTTFQVRELNTLLTTRPLDATKCVRVYRGCEISHTRLCVLRLSVARKSLWFVVAFALAARA